MSDDECRGRLGHAVMGAHGGLGYLHVGESGKVLIAFVLSTGDRGDFRLVDRG